MTRVTIVAETPGSPDTKFLASARKRESIGPTAGAALDALTSQLDESESGTLIVIQNLRPDEFFTNSQQQRLSELLVKWREAKDTVIALPSHEQIELESLEYRASGCLST